MAGTSWIYQVKKEQIVTYLNEFGIDPVGTVEELRRRFIQFIGNHGSTYGPRLEELASKHGQSGQDSTADEDEAKDEATPTTQDESFVEARTIPTYTWPTYTIPTAVTTVTTTHATSHKPMAMGQNIPTQIYPPTSACYADINPTIRTIDVAAIMERVRKWSVRYHGGPGAFEFIECVEELADTYNIQFDILPRTMIELLQHSPLCWYWCNRNRCATWPQFKQEFIGYFVPSQYFEQLEDNIQQRKQGPRESFKDYSLIMQTLMYHARLDVVEKLSLIYRNSRQEYRVHIKRKEFNDLSELLSLAEDLEIAKGTTNINPTRPGGERTRQVAITPNVPDRIDVRTACRRCGQAGHFRCQCQNPTLFFCWQCRKTNIRTVDCCRQQSGNDHEAPMRDQGGPQN